MDKFKSSVCSNEFSTTVNEKAQKDILKDSYRTLKKDLNKDGTLNLIIVMEEFSELIQQVSKFVRGKDNHYELLEEVADGYLCLEYIKDLCGLSDVEVNKAINVKLARQAKRNKEDTF